MKVYFIGSARGDFEDRDFYSRIVTILERHGEVLSEYSGDIEVTELGEKRKSADIYERDIAWLRTADIVVAEVSVPSLGVGYEIALAERLGKPVLCLFRNGHGKHALSAIIAGNSNLTVREYDSLLGFETAFKHFLREL